MTTESQAPDTRTLAARSKHQHYFKPVAHLTEIDVYRVITLFAVTDPCIAHAVKKLLLPGQRGAGKGEGKDIQEAIDTLKRWQEMRAEDSRFLIDGAGQ